ncbi:hypothetical protein P7K49_030602 [Saguinus oedipus]|uniref:Uncharacterized protein n=1 Tax=Saguinus oedipus TaxID=9490 RepID=A0ABQ9U2M6_SAGOE|nr:hypothetical protein P7K49_030602 [Saguinus oedipus]
MPGIDKLPIEETLEDSPQGEPGWPTPGLAPAPLPQVPARAQVGAAAARGPRPSQAAPRAVEAGPTARGPRPRAETEPLVLVGRATTLPAECARVAAVTVVAVSRAVHGE